MHYEGPPATSLSVTIHSGRELKVGDLFGKSDPFVKIELGGKEQKTTVKKGGAPVWEQTFTFNYSAEPNIKFYVYDKDFLRNDFLGVQDFALLPILSNPERHFSGEVGVTSKKGKSAGYLKVTLQFYPKGDGTHSGANTPKVETQQQHCCQAPTVPVPCAATPCTPHYSPPAGYAPGFTPAGPQQVVNAQFPGYGTPARPAYGPYPGYPPVTTPWPQQGYPPQQYPSNQYPPQQYPHGQYPPQYNGYNQYGPPRY